MTEKWSPGKFDLDQVTGRFQFTTFEMAGFHTEHIERKSNLPETYENKRAWVSYIFPANTIFYLETCCDTFHVHFQSVIPWCWSQWFCRTAGTRSAKRVLARCNKTQLPAIVPFVKSPYGVTRNWRQTSLWKSWWRRFRWNAQRAMRGEASKWLYSTLRPNPLMSCSNRGCHWSGSGRTFFF